MAKRNLSIAVNDEIIQALDRIQRARGEKWTRNGVAREALEQYIRKHIDEIQRGGGKAKAQGE